jgi:hypothetical protein
LALSAGPIGGEVLSALAVAVHAQVPVDTLRHMIYAYPAFHRGIEDALRHFGYASRFLRRSDAHAPPPHCVRGHRTRPAPTRSLSASFPEVEEEGFSWHPPMQPQELAHYP